MLRVVAGAGMAISQWIFTNFRGRSPRPAAPPVPSGSGSSRAAGALRGLQPVVPGMDSRVVLTYTIIDVSSPPTVFSKYLEL